MVHETVFLGEGGISLGMIQRGILAKCLPQMKPCMAYHGFINRISGLVWKDASGEAGDALLHLKRRKEECPNALNREVCKRNP